MNLFISIQINGQNEIVRTYLNKFVFIILIIVMKNNSESKKKADHFELERVMFLILVRLKKKN